MRKPIVRTILAALFVATLSAPAGAAGSKKASSGGHGGGEAKVERFIEMKTLTAPIISSRRVRGQLEISLMLEVKDEALGPEIARKLPRLEANFVTVANNYAASLGLPTKRIDIVFLMKGLQAEADRLFPPGTVAVLVQQAQYRR